MAEARHVEIHDDNSLYDFIDLITRSHQEFDVQSLQYVNLDTILPRFTLPTSLPVLENSVVDQELLVPWTGGRKYCCVNKVYSYMFDVFKEISDPSCCCAALDPKGTEPCSLEESTASSFLQPPRSSQSSGRSKYQKPRNSISSCSDTTNSYLSDTSDVDSDYISSDNLSDIFVTENCDNLNFKIELLNNSRGSSGRALPNSHNTETSPALQAEKSELDSEGSQVSQYVELQQSGTVREEIPPVPSSDCDRASVPSEQFRMPHLYSTLVAQSSLAKSESLPERVVSVKQEAETFAGIKVSCNNVCREYDEIAREGKSKFKKKKKNPSGEFIGRITINVTKYTKNSIRTRVDIVRKRYGGHKRNSEKTKLTGGRKVDKYRGSEEKDSSTRTDKSSVCKTKQNKRNIAKKKKASSITTNYSRKCCKYEYRGKGKPADHSEEGSCAAIREEGRLGVQNGEHEKKCENLESEGGGKNKRHEKSSISNGIVETTDIGANHQQNKRLENENHFSVRTDGLAKPDSVTKKLDSGKDRKKVIKNENMAQEKTKHKQRNGERENESVLHSSQGKSESSGDKRGDRCRNGTDKSQTERHRRGDGDKKSLHKKSSSSRNHNIISMDNAKSVKLENSDTDNRNKQVSSNNKTELVHTNPNTCEKFITKPKSDKKHSVKQKDKKLSSKSYMKPQSSLHKLEILPNNSMKEIVDKHKNNLDNVKHHKRKITQDIKTSEEKSSSIISSKDSPPPIVSKNVEVKHLHVSNIAKDDSRIKISESNIPKKDSPVMKFIKTNVGDKQQAQNSLPDNSPKSVSVLPNHSKHEKDQHSNGKDVSHKVQEGLIEKNNNSTSKDDSLERETKKSSSYKKDPDNSRPKSETNESVKSSERLKEECKKIVEKYLKKKKENLTNELKEETVDASKLTIRENDVIPKNTVTKEKEGNKKKVMNLDEYKKRKGQYLPKNTTAGDDKNVLNVSNLSSPKTNAHANCEKNITPPLITSVSTETVVDGTSNTHTHKDYINKVSTIKIEKDCKMAIDVKEICSLKDNISNSAKVIVLENVKVEVVEKIQNDHINKIEKPQLTNVENITIMNDDNMKAEMKLATMKTEIEPNVKVEASVEDKNILTSIDKSEKSRFKVEYEENKTLRKKNPKEQVNGTEDLEKAVLIKNDTEKILNHADICAKTEEEEKEKNIVTNETEEHTKIVVSHVFNEDVKIKDENIGMISKEKLEKDLKTPIDINKEVSTIESIKISGALLPNEKPIVSKDTAIKNKKKEPVIAPREAQKLIKSEKVSKEPQEIKEDSSDDTEEGEISDGDNPSEEERDIKQKHQSTTKLTHNSKKKERHPSGFGKADARNIICEEDRKNYDSNEPREYQRRKDENCPNKNSRERLKKRKSRSVSSSSSSSSSSRSSSNSSSSSSSSGGSSSSSSSSADSKPILKRLKQRPNSFVSNPVRNASYSAQKYPPPSKNGPAQIRTSRRAHDRFKGSCDSQKGLQGHSKKPYQVSSAASNLNRPEGMESLKIELHYGSNDKTPPKRCINLAPVSQEVKAAPSDGASRSKSNHPTSPHDKSDHGESDLNKSHISISDTSVESCNTTGNDTDPRSSQDPSVRTINTDKLGMNSKKTPKSSNGAHKDLQHGTSQKKGHTEMDTSHQNKYSKTDITESFNRNGNGTGRKSAGQSISRNGHPNNSKTSRQENHLLSDISYQRRSSSRSFSQKQNSKSLSPRESFAQDSSRSRHSASSNCSASVAESARKSNSPRKPQSASFFRENSVADRRSNLVIASRMSSRYLRPDNSLHPSQQRSTGVNPRRGGSENHFPLHSEFVRNQSYASRHRSPSHPRAYDNTLRRSRSNSPGHRKYTPTKGYGPVRVKPAYRHASSHSPSLERTTSPRRNPISSERASGFPSVVSRRNRSYRKRERSSSLEARSASSMERHSSDSSSLSDSDDSCKAGSINKSRKRSLSSYSSERSSPECDTSAEWKRGIREYRTLYVGGILPSSTVEELRVRFQRFGTITGVHMVRKFFEHYAYVTFKRADAIRNAIERGNDPYYVNDEFLLPVVGPYYMLDYATPDYDQQDIVRRVAYQVKYADSFESTLASTMELLSRRKKQKVIGTN